MFRLQLTKLFDCATRSTMCCESGLRFYVTVIMNTSDNPLSPCRHPEPASFSLLLFAVSHPSFGIPVKGIHVYRPQDGQEAYRAQSPSTFQSSPATDDRHTSRNRDRKGTTTKTRFPSLAPAPGSFRSSGDVRAAEAVAHARKTWAPPALRTQAVTSYGAVPDLEVMMYPRRRVFG